MATAIKVEKIPREFIWRRLHSLMGLWFLIFLMEHLFTNSQIMIFFAENALWFVHSVDFLQGLPYLHAIEVTLLGVPILYHAIWGIYYMFGSKPNSFSTDGSKPSMKYGRSKAYTWQRMTAWILIVGIILHVVQMRFIHYPYKTMQEGKPYYYAKIQVDPGLYATAEKLDVTLYDQKGIDREKGQIARLESKMNMVSDRLKELEQDVYSDHEENQYSSELDHIHQNIASYEAKCNHIKGLESRKIEKNEVIAVSKSFGSLELLYVREAFQSLTMCLLYTIFVAAAVFHGFNGLWTFLITWGLILSRKSQSKMSTFSIGLMFVVGILGMMAIWGTFFFNINP